MADDITIDLSGAAELIRALGFAEETIAKALAVELYGEAELVMTESKKIVPFEFGTLENSGYVAQPEVHLGEISVTLGYGGAAMAYALRQHEDLTLHHENGRQAKYLETPLLEASKDMPERIAAKVRSELGL